MFKVNEEYKNFYGNRHKILAIYKDYMIAECLDDVYSLEIYTLDGYFVASVENIDLTLLEDYLRIAENNKRISLKLLDNA